MVRESSWQGLPVLASRGPYGGRRLLRPATGADLEEEEKYTKIRKGIEAKVAKLAKLSKAKRLASDDMKVLRQLITREDVKKLFKDKGVSLKDIVADVIA